MGTEYLLDKFVFEIPEYKILVTSRYEFPSFDSIYNLPFLKDDDAMTLFGHLAFLPDGSSYIADQDIVKKVKIKNRAFNKL